MQAKDLMCREPRAVRMHDRLDAAARVMWEHDCGLCPVVDASGVLVGVLTDRDLCMASYTQGKALLEIPVAAVMARAVRTCRPEDTVAIVLQTLQQAQVHRLPVVDARGMLVGVVGTNDLLRAAHARPAAVDAAAVVKTMATIGSPRAPVAAVRPTAVAAPAPAATPAAVAPVAAVVASAAVAAAAPRAAATPAPAAPAPAAPVPATPPPAAAAVAPKPVVAAAPSPAAKAKAAGFPAPKAKGKKGKKG